jgi:Cysteine rich repeat
MIAGLGVEPRHSSEALESIGMKHLVALIMIAFLVPTAAMAKNSACKEDKAKFCKDVKAAGGKVNDCLKQHKAEVSAACKEALDKPKEAKPGKDEKAKKKDETKAPSEAAQPNAAKPADSAKPAQSPPPSQPASPGQSDTKP